MNGNSAALNTEKKEKQNGVKKYKKVEIRPKEEVVENIDIDNENDKEDDGIIFD